jgi:hypothetical protein
MIYLAYATHVELNGELIPVNGNRSRINAISQYIDNEYTIMSLGDTKPNYIHGDIIIIDPGNQQYEHLLDADVFSVLLSDEFGVQYEGTGVDLVVYVSGGAEDFSWEATSYGNAMFYAVSKDVQENSWIGGETVMFIPGSNYIDYWKNAQPYMDYCEEHGIDFVVTNDVPHNLLMQDSRNARCVITAAGVTAKEMVYQGAPTVLILTAPNQMVNYSYFIYQKLAMPQGINPDVLTDTFTLSMVARQASNMQKQNTSHMLEMIQKVYNEIYR